MVVCPEHSSAIKSDRAGYFDRGNTLLRARSNPPPAVTPQICCKLELGCCLDFLTSRIRLPLGAFRHLANLRLSTAHGTSYGFGGGARFAGTTRRGGGISPGGETMPALRVLARLDQLARRQVPKDSIRLGEPFGQEQPSLASNQPSSGNQMAISRLADSVESEP